MSKSSVLIKGMELPQNCAECRFWSICECLNDFEDYVSVLDAVDDGDLVRDGDYPLVEVKVQRGRLIDEDTVTAIYFSDADGEHCVCGERLDGLEIEADTVIEAEGSEE